MNRKFQVEHAPLSVSADGVLLYPILSGYYPSLPHVPFLPNQPFHHLEMAALMATICEIYRCPFDLITSEHIHGYRKIIQHLAKKSMYASSDLMASIIETRLFEILDIINKKAINIRVGSVLCGSCRSRNLKVEINPISIKGVVFDGYLMCDCGAIGLLSNNRLMGVPVNEFNWIKRLQCNAVINEAVASKVYLIDELALFLVNTHKYHSIFGVNPYNKIVTDKQLSQIIGEFGAICRHIKKTGHEFDKAVSAFGLKFDPSSSMLKQFMKESESSNFNLENVQKLRDILKGDIE